MIWTPELLEAIDAGWEAFRERLAAEVYGQYDAVTVPHLNLLDPGEEVADEVDDGWHEDIAWALVAETLAGCVMTHDSVPELAEEHWLKVNIHLALILELIHGLGSRVFLEELR